MHPRRVCRRLFAVLALSGLVAAGSVVGSPAAGAATEPNRNYVRSLYGDILDRPSSTASKAGVEFWANRLASHSRLDVVEGLQHSTGRYFGIILDINYALFLDRKPDAHTRAFYVDGLRSRKISLNNVVAHLVGSSEYFAKAGGTNGLFVDKAFADILGFGPSVSARNHFIAVAKDKGRAAVAVILATSLPARSALIRFQYRSFLGRPVDPSTLTSWLKKFRQGLRREDFDATLLSSQEYFDKNS